MKLQEFKRLIREEIRNVIKEVNVPKPGSKIDDYDLYEKGYLGDYGDDWLELFSDDPALSPTNKIKFVSKANKFLKSKKMSWQVKDIVKQNDEGEITWVIA
jgi:hypothetical protein